jgi:phosphonoacetaldehyde hydrolase
MFRNTGLVTRKISSASSTFFRVPYQTRHQSPFIKKLTSTENRITACILDFSGTMTDRYVIAPAIAFVNTFQKHRVPISMETARIPMGLRKDLHIQELCTLDIVRTAWEKVYGCYPNPSLDKGGDAARLFEDFKSIQLACIRNYGTLIPGAIETAEELRKNRIKIGATTGFIREEAAVLIEEARKQGFRFDCTVTGDEVENGARPYPFMLYRNMALLNVPNPSCVVKVGDTLSDVGEGLYAGCWTVAVFEHSNYVNINNLEEATTISAHELACKREKARKILEASGAHYVIPSIRDLPRVIADINHRLSLGKTPESTAQIEVIEEEERAQLRR